METITKAIYPDFSKAAAERSIEVLIQDKETGDMIGKQWITKAELARELQPLNRTCHCSKNGKFVLVK